MHELQFYEDDPGQIIVAPFANRHYYQREFAALVEHAEQHRAPGGIGWTKMYEPSDDEVALEDTVALRSLDITEARFIELLTPCMPLRRFRGQKSFPGLGSGQIITNHVRRSVRRFVMP